MIFQKTLQDAENPSQRLFSCFCYTTDGGSFPSHCHLFLEMVYQASGQSGFVLDGQMRVMNPGDIVFVPIMKPHAIHTSGEALNTHLIIQISPRYFDFGAQNSDFVRRIQRGPALSGDMACSVSGDAGARMLLDELCRESNFSSPDSLAVMSRTLDSAASFAAHCRINGLLFLLIARLLNLGVLAISDGALNMLNVNELSRLEPVLELMTTHPERTLSMEDAAQICNMSYYSFSRTFKRAIGDGFIEYQNMLRVRFAEDLLQSSDESITQIAERASFGSLSYFNRVFKLVNGLSPSAFRKRAVQNKTKISQNRD